MGMAFSTHKERDTRPCNVNGLFGLS
jgi:hypothetical protein